MNQQSQPLPRPWVRPLLCSANAYISLRKAQAALNILLNAIHLGAELDGHIPGTGPMAMIYCVEIVWDLVFNLYSNVCFCFFLIIIIFSN